MDKVDPPNDLDAHCSELRHALRNRFAAIRNASFYIRKKVERGDVLMEDTRVQTFFDLIDRELADCDDLISRTLTAEALVETPPRKT